MKTNASLASLCLVCVFGAGAASISIADLNVGYAQDFDSLASSGTSSTMPLGWELSESGTAANATYAAGTGSGTTGNTYSFGEAGSSERALGGLSSGSLVPTFGASFQNNTLALISSFQIAYVGEQWRHGTAGSADRLGFQFSTDATSLATGTWTDFNALDFVGPITSGSAGALDGNAAANQQSITATLVANWTSGSTLWIRWMDNDATGSDEGLAIDNFSIRSVAAVPETLPRGLELVLLLTLFGTAHILYRRKTCAIVR